MTLFLIERNFAEKLQVTRESGACINQINDPKNIRWLISFLSLDKKRTFCLYEADSAEAILKAAKRAGIPADEIIEISEEVLPNGARRALQVDRFG